MIVKMSRLMAKIMEGERKKCETPEIKAGKKKGQTVMMNLKEGALKDKRSSFSTMELLYCEGIFLKTQ